MRLKKFVQIFLSIFAYLINLVYTVVTEICRAFAPYKERERVRRLYPVSLPIGVTCTRKWLYEMFSRWHLDRSERGLKIAI